MKKYLIIWLLILLAKSFCYGQINDPLTLAKTIFSRDTFPELEKYITGEYDGHPNGTDLFDNVTVDFLLLGQDSSTAVVNITLTDSLGQADDVYLHFVRDSIWKVTAFRGLALTGITYEITRILESLNETQIDSIIELSKNDSSGGHWFKSREEYEYELGNSCLTLASDNEIIAHFKKNERKFNRIKDSILVWMEDTVINNEKEISIGKRFESEMMTLLLSSINIGGYGLGNCINFRIGGIVDNDVGYIYVRNEKDVPEMNTYRIIMIREIGNGWYMYKTT